MEFPERLEDFAEPEVGLAAVAVVALLSPTVRRGLRWGLVQGLTGLLAASDRIAALTRQLTSTEQHASDDSFRQKLVDEAKVEQAKGVRTHTAAGRQREP